MYFDRSTYYRQSCRTDPAFLKKRVKEIYETHVRFVYRQAKYVLRRDGWLMNISRCTGFTESWALVHDPLATGRKRLT